MRARESAVKSACFISALVLAASLLCAADDSDYKIRVKSTEVQLEFTVTDSSGRPVHQLTQEDIAVVDNGDVIRKFRSFRSIQGLPADLVLIVDTSDSMSSRLAKILQHVSKLLSSDLWEKDDRVTVLAFKDGRVVSVCTLDCQKLGASGLDETGRSNTSPLFDALLSAAKLLEQTRLPQHRPAILIITDGMENMSLIGSSSALAAVQEVGAPIYVWGLDHRERSEKSSLFALMAELSGGFLLPMQMSITTSVGSVLQEMRQCFIVSYEPLHPLVRRHSVQIMPKKDPRLMFRSRLGYAWD